MSHTVKLALAMRDKANLKRACEALKIPFQEGPHTVQLFSGQTSQADFSVQLPNWRYRVGIDLKAGEVAFDNYGGSWGRIEELHRFAQEYACQCAENEESVQELLNKGWTCERVKHKNGQVDIILEK